MDRVVVLIRLGQELTDLLNATAFAIDQHHFESLIIAFQVSMQLIDQLIQIVQAGIDESDAVARRFLCGLCCVWVASKAAVESAVASAVETALRAAGSMGEHMGEVAAVAKIVACRHTIQFRVDQRKNRIDFVLGYFITTWQRRAIAQINGQRRCRIEHAILEHEGFERHVAKFMGVRLANGRGPTIS